MCPGKSLSFSQSTPIDAGRHVVSNEEVDVLPVLPIVGILVQNGVRLKRFC